VQKGGDSGWQIMRLDAATREITPLASTLAGREDYAWLPDGRLVMGSGSALYTWDAEANTWTPLRDLAAFGIADITRLAASPDGRHLAVVAAD
jgi:hypothetical protein